MNPTYEMTPARMAFEAWMDARTPGWNGSFWNRIDRGFADMIWEGFLAGYESGCDALKPKETARRS